jgi:hypothetical protein
MFDCQPLVKRKEVSFETSNQEEHDSDLLLFLSRSL